MAARALILQNPSSLDLHNCRHASFDFSAPNFFTSNTPLSYDSTAFPMGKRTLTHDDSSTLPFSSFYDITSPIYPLWLLSPVFYFC